MRGYQSGPALVGQSLGAYVLERLLGRGGMGSVYAARHRDIGKVVALKVLHADDAPSESFRLRFLREGQAAGRIRHRNVVDLYDAGNDGGRDFLVMELLEGEDLRKLLQREGPLPVERACDLIVPLAAGLLAAHELGVVHRDLKPDNVFISSSRGFLIPKLLDFGVSKLTQAQASGFSTSTGMMVGTPMYMSPEQAASKKVIDSRSDQYALGVILYECVTGRRPVEESTLFRLMQRIIEGDYPAPRQLNPSLPAGLESVIRTAMAREPAERFSSMRELGQALLPFAGEAVRAEYTREFAGASFPAIAVSESPRLQPAPLAESTLRESVQLREAKGQPLQPRRRWRWLIAASAMGLGVAGAAAWQAANARLPASPAVPVRPASTTTVRSLAASVASPTEPKPETVPGPDQPPDARRVPEPPVAPVVSPPHSRQEELTKHGAVPGRVLADRNVPQRSVLERSSTTRPSKARTKAPTIDPFADQK